MHSCSSPTVVIIIERNQVNNNPHQQVSRFSRVGHEKTTGRWLTIGAHLAVQKQTTNSHWFSPLLPKPRQ